MFVLLIGKTSLLNILANRLPFQKNATLTGSVSVNGKALEPRVFARISAYIMQDDALYATMTVKVMQIQNMNKNNP